MSALLAQEVTGKNFAVDGAKTFKSCLSVIVGIATLKYPINDRIVQELLTTNPIPSTKCMTFRYSVLHFIVY